MEGAEKIWIVKNKAEAEKTLKALLLTPGIALILTTNQVFEWVKASILKELKNQKHPVIVSMTGKKEPKEQADLLTEISKRVMNYYH
jgi:vacuolar-type H+-ATPase subunit F/Vma7